MSAAPRTAPAARLRDLLRRPRPARLQQERCDMCAEPLPEVHRHMLDVPQSAVMCSCRPCTLLFDQGTAGGKHYRLLPERRLPLAGFWIEDVLWVTLGVPVGLAFFVRDSVSGEVTVSYPSPLGATRSAVEPQVWEEVTQGHPDLAGLEDGVEALLVHRAGTAREHWIVPLDDCYRLVAVVRTHWRGLSGGSEVWGRIDAFFAGLSGQDRAQHDPRSRHG